MLTQILVKDGFFVTRALDGDEGVAAFEKQGPHVCLVDCLLPRKSGFEVAKAMRAHGGDKVGVILMSAAFRRAERDVLADTGADGFISKPFVLGDLRKRVKELADEIV